MCLINGIGKIGQLHAKGKKESRLPTYTILNDIFRKLSVDIARLLYRKVVSI